MPQALCLRFLALTAGRSNEARGTRWNEIEESDAAWHIPADRMKSGIEHRVPLSRQSLEVLDAARQLGDGSGLVFPSPPKPGRPLSWQTLLKLPTSAATSSVISPRLKRCLTSADRLTSSLSATAVMPSYVLIAP